MSESTPAVDQREQLEHLDLPPADSDKESEREAIEGTDEGEGHFTQLKDPQLEESPSLTVCSLFVFITNTNVSFSFLIFLSRRDSQARFHPLHYYCRSVSPLFRRCCIYLV